MLHTAHLWQRWSTLTDCVRAGTAVARDEIAGRGEDWTEAFIAAMHRNASERAPLVVRAVGAENVRRMLDVGGGSGAYSIAFAQANSALRADILDLAAVEPIAQRHIQEAGVADRVKVRAGDLRSDRLGEGYDLVFVSAICHMLSPAENLDLLRRCREALAPGGRVVIQDFILEADKTAPALRRAVRAQHAGGHARRQQLQRAGVCRLARRGGFPGDPPRAPAGNHRAHDWVAGIARGVDMSVDAARTSACATCATLAKSAVLCNTRWQMKKLVCLFSLLLIPLAGQAPANGTWKFAVSGDSRNCGNIVMPAIARRSAGEPV